MGAACHVGLGMIGISDCVVVPCRKWIIMCSDIPFGRHVVFKGTVILNFFHQLDIYELDGSALNNNTICWKYFVCYIYKTTGVW